ncbi:MAG: PIN domain-containing protein [Caulobacteraceae bacterium]
MIHLDTHVLVWAHLAKPRLLSQHAKMHLRRGPCRVSPMVLFELKYLQERGRLRESAKAVFESVAAEIDLTVSDAPFAEIVEAAEAFAWTRDPFDRLIVATAAWDGARLLTADPTILENFPGAVW